MNKCFIKFDNVSVRLGNKIVLSDINWEIKENENWAIIGHNGAGKSTLAKTIMGKTQVVKGSIRPLYSQNKIGYVSFDLHSWLMEEENKLEDLRSFSGKINKTTRVKDIILRSNKLSSKSLRHFLSVINILQINYLLSKNINQLSNGEIRKVIIARAMVKKPRLLILDEPFEGLDQKSRNEYQSVISNLIKKGIKILFITNRLEEIPPDISHALVLINGNIFIKREKAEALHNLPIYALFKQHNLIKNDLSRNANRQSQIAPDVLIEMNNVTVRYGQKIVLKNINWQMQKGENWAIVGPNGSGKSTILKLITGDVLQAYANNISILGFKKGDGKSIWEIKKYIGEVSPDLQLRYQKDVSVFEVIISGFFDSVGIIQTPTPQQIKQANKWISIFHLNRYIHKKIADLSSGQQRMIFFARAMVKNPLLLILDEPCQGLDLTNRKQILDVIENLSKYTNLLLVTHHKDEIPKCINKIMYLNNSYAKFN